MDLIFLFLFAVFISNSYLIFHTILNFRSYELDKDLIYISTTGISCNIFLTYIFLNLSDISVAIKHLI